MNTFLRNTLAAVVMTAGLSVAAQAATTAEVPPLSQDPVVQQQLAAFAQLDQQTRYYRVKYYFGINQVLTAEQREQVKKDLQQALN